MKTKRQLDVSKKQKKQLAVDKKQKKQTVVVVLGMHRSGTSAITRGLQVMGVDLGEHLMPPAADQNEKGFFEDIDVNAINVELLNSVGADWHTLTFVPENELLDGKHAPLRLRAIQLLRERLKDVEYFGIKDPRMCRLLPFWKRVFEHLQLNVVYIIAVRNPLSVAKSLEKRDRLPSAKCHYLWLEHILPSMLLTEGEPRVVVDYDLLMNDPERQIARMARALDIKGKKLDPVRLAEFTQEFLEERLRHANYQANDVLEDPAVPLPVRTAVKVLADVAADELSIDSEEVRNTFGNLSKQLEGMEQIMAYLVHLDGIIAHVHQTLAQRNNDIAVLHQHIAERDSQMYAQQQLLAERGNEIAALNQELEERAGRIQWQAQSLVAREGEINSLHQHVAERDAQIQAQAQALNEHQAQIGALHQHVAERDAQIQAQAQALNEHQAQIGVLHQHIAERDAQFQAQAQVLNKREAQIGELHQHIAERDAQIQAQAQALNEHQAQIGALHQHVAERDAQIQAQAQALNEHQAQIGALHQHVAERDAQIQAQAQALNEREAQIGALHQHVAEQDAQIGALHQHVAERDAQIQAQAQALNEHQAQIGALHQHVAERDAQIQAQAQALNEHQAQIGALHQHAAERDAQIQAQAQALNERDAQIDALHQHAAEHDAQIQAQAQALNEQDAQIGALHQHVAERDAQIQAQAQALHERDAQIGALHQHVAERDAQIQVQAQALHERDAQIGALHQHAAERDAQIQAQEQALHERDAQIDALHQHAAERDAQIQAQEQALHERDAQIDALHQHAAERDTQIQVQAEALHERDAQIDALHQHVAEREASIVDLNQHLAEQDALIHEQAESLSAREALLDARTQELSERETLAEALRQELAERNALIESQVQELSAYEALLNEQSQDISERDAQLAALRQELAGREADMQSQVLTIAAREAQIAIFDQEIVERDAQLDALHQENAEQNERLQSQALILDEWEAQIRTLNQGFEEQLAHLQMLQQQLAERDSQIQWQVQMLAERDAQLAAMGQGLAERQHQVESLAQVVTQKEAAIQQQAVNVLQFKYRLDKTRSSLGWKLLKPERKIKRLLSNKLRIELFPYNQLHKEDGGWLSSGNDAQFLLLTERAWNGLSGWYWLEIDTDSVQPLNAQLYFDRGNGFDPSLTINFQLNGKGVQKIPFYVPVKCRAVRFDPCDAPGKFKLSVIGLDKLKEPPSLPEEFSGQSSIYEILGGWEGNGLIFNPVNGIQRSEQSDYTWRSNSDDPWFLLEGTERKFSPGWHLIELQIRSSGGRGMAKLYFDLGEGYNELDSVVLPFANGQKIERLYFLKSVPRQIRFDPLESSGAFSIEHLKFAPEKPDIVRKQMLARLSEFSKQYQGHPIGKIWRDLRRQSKNEDGAAQLLYQRYGKTFPLTNAPGGAENYEEWIAKHETPEFSDLAAIESAQNAFHYRPLISVVMPTYNTPEFALRQVIDSVLGQSYPHWEFCIADDASPEANVRRVLEEYRQRDSRIKVIFRQENGHISAASNSALSLATGDYVALLDHDDELAPHALHFAVDAINKNPAVQVIYSDEDKIDENGNRTDPHFKSDWNPDLFLSQNYVSHLGVYRRSLLQLIGGFRLGVEGSQDHDLLLRCLPHIQVSEVVHIPKILYHWRILEGSTARGSRAKDYTSDAAVTALQDFFSMQGRQDIKVETGLVPNTYRIRYPIPQPEPLVSLLIPTRDKLELLEPCIRSIREKTTYRNYEILILDNGSVELDTLEYFKRIQAEDRRVRVLRYDHPFNYSAINNFGVQHANGELIGLVNNDIEVISPEWLSEMAGHALRQEIGCVGAKLYYDDETIQHAGVIIGLGGVAGHSHKGFFRESSGYFHRLNVTQNLSAVTAACLIVRKAVYEQVGGLEEASLRVAFNDVDFCLKVREAGYRNLWTPYAELFHHESKSRGVEDTPEKIARFNSEMDFMKTKWGEMLQKDPYYNPNLTLAREDFSLK